MRSLIFITLLILYNPILAATQGETGKTSTATVKITLIIKKYKTDCVRVKESEHIVRIICE